MPNMIFRVLSWWHVTEHEKLLGNKKCDANNDSKKVYVTKTYDQKEKCENQVWDKKEN